MVLHPARKPAQEARYWREFLERLLNRSSSSAFLACRADRRAAGEPPLRAPRQHPYNQTHAALWGKIAQLVDSLAGSAPYRRLVCEQTPIMFPSLPIRTQPRRVEPHVCRTRARWIKGRTGARQRETAVNVIFGQQRLSAETSAIFKPNPQASRAKRADEHVAGYKVVEDVDQQRCHRWRVRVLYALSVTGWTPSGKKPRQSRVRRSSMLCEYDIIILRMGGRCNSDFTARIESMAMVLAARNSGGCVCISDAVRRNRLIRVHPGSDSRSRDRH